MLPRQSTLAGVPPWLAEETIRAGLRATAGQAASGEVSASVSSLLEGVLMTMSLVKVKTAVVAVLAVIATSVLIPAFLAVSHRQEAGRAQIVYGEEDGVVENLTAKPATGENLASRSLREEAIELATRAFGPGHWSTDRNLPVRYYNEGRGYWMYAREYERLNDGKQLRLKPFALIGHSRDKEELKSVVSDEAIVELDPLLGLWSQPKGFTPGLVRALFSGDVRLRDHRGTDDTADDLVIGPMRYAEYDAPRLRITSESVAVIEDRDVRITGAGLQVLLRHEDESEPPGRLGDIAGVKSVSFRRIVKIDVKDTDRAALPPNP
jgi:hypothetical protein